MAALVRRGLKIQPFKCGPDYIDPMFHTFATGRPSRNLDPFMLPAGTLRYLLQKNARGTVAIIEGVMGFYDGLNTGTAASTYEVGAKTKTPVLLVLNAGGMSASLAAVIGGFVRFRPDNGIAGILLNGVGERFYKALKPMLEKETGLDVLGFLPRMEDCSLENRHLGLITAAEVEGLGTKINSLARQAEQSVDLDRVLEVASAAPPLPAESSPLEALPPEEFVRDIGPFRLGVARDEAFCFYYRDALDLLEELGAELVSFSPLNDLRLPGELDGLYLGGGYPEVHAARLSSNGMMLDDIRRQVLGGLPTLAECGGFMTLCRAIQTDEGLFPMSGVFGGEVRMTPRLVRFGYVKLTAKKPSLLAPEGWTGRGHEFHCSESTDNGDGFKIEKSDGRTWKGIHTNLPGQSHPTLHAGYPHLHLYGDPRLAANFARACVEYGKNKKARKATD
jgi:cobyrinic acid a,c-diamide synthase